MTRSLRFAVLALALSLGAGGARALAVSGQGGTPAACGDAALRTAHDVGAPARAAVAVGPRAPSGGGWRAPEPEPTSGSGPGPRSCRTASTPALELHPTRGLPDDTKRHPARSAGLLGLPTSPANAPPGS